MADNVTSTTVICQGGLDTTENHLLLDANQPGAASQIVNYECGLYGGYKRLDGYEYLDSDFKVVGEAFGLLYDDPEVLYDGTDVVYGVDSPSEGEGPVLGIFIFKNQIIAARKLTGSLEYNYFLYQDGTGWTPYTLGFTLDSTNSNGDVKKIRSINFTFGSVDYIAFVDGVNPLTVYDGTTWFQCLSTNTGGSGSAGGDQLIDAPSYISMFNNTIFVAGDPTYTGIVANSAPEDVLTWTAAAGGGQILAGCPVVQIKPFRDFLYVWGKERIRYITLDGTDFVIKDVAANIGCIASDSVIELNGDILFLAQDGIRTISGTAKIGDVNLASISKQVQRLVNELQEGYDLFYLNSVVIKKKSQFRYFVSNGTILDTGVGIIGMLRGSGDSTSMEYFELSGIRTACTAVGYYNGQEVVLHGDYDGSVYVQESGNTFNGTPVISIFSTPYLTFGDILTRKRVDKIHVFTKYNGPFDLGMSFSLDWKNTKSLSPSTFAGGISTDSSLYDVISSIYDGSGVVYAEDIEYPVIDFDVLSSFKSLKLIFTTSSDSFPHTIQGFVFDFTPQHKR